LMVTVTTKDEARRVSMKKSIAVAVSLVALTFVVLGVSQAGGGVVGGVRVALFAKNSGKVNGLQASKAPRPGRLVPLGKNGKFPRSEERRVGKECRSRWETDY